MTRIDIIPAFSLMLGSLTAAEAGPVQIGGVLGWQQAVAYALGEGAAYCAAAGSSICPAGRQVDGFETSTHRAWTGMCQALITAVEAQRGQALASWYYWLRLAARHQDQRDLWLERAARCSTQDARSWCIASAERHEEARVRCEELAGLAGRWWVAADAAAAAGKNLVRGESARLGPIGQAIHRQGVKDTAQAKSYHVV